MKIRAANKNYCLRENPQYGVRYKTETLITAPALNAREIYFQTQKRKKFVRGFNCRSVFGNTNHTAGFLQSQKDNCNGYVNKSRLIL